MRQMLFKIHISEHAVCIRRVGSAARLEMFVQIKQRVVTVEPQRRRVPGADGEVRADCDV